MCESAERYESGTGHAESTSARTQKKLGTPDEKCSAAVCIATALVVVGLTALGGVATRRDVSRGNQPSDEELRSNFFFHRAGFDHVVRMLAADYPGVTGKGTTSMDLAALARLDVNTTRFRMYKSLLKQISVADFRYYRSSGKLILVPEGQQDPKLPSKSYLYVPHPQPDPLVHYHGYTWREPGMYILTRDDRLRGPWLIHHDVVIGLAFSPY